MTKVHSSFIDETVYNLHIGDTIKVGSSKYGLSTSGYVYSANVYYSNMGESYYIYQISSKEKELINSTSRNWVDSGALVSSESIGHIIQKRLLLTEKIVK